MDLGALDGALDPWRREREAKAWARYSALQARAKELRHQAHVARLEACSALGKLGEHASAGAALDIEAARVEKSAAWWKVNRLTVRRYEERRRECGRETYEGICGHCGLFHSWPKSCGAHQVCADCARARTKKLARRLIPAIRLQHERAKTKWYARGRPTGQLPVLTLMTLTLRSESLADLSERRKLLSESWNRFRSWWQGKERAKLSYAWTAECTEGTANQGHVHIHVVTMLPFRDYKLLGKAWERATGAQGGHADFRRARTDAKRAAFYIAKYASKGTKFESVQVGAAWVVAQHGKRGVSTSRDFWWVDPIVHGPWQLTLRPTRADDADTPHGKHSSRPDPADSG